MHLVTLYEERTKRHITIVTERLNRERTGPRIPPDKLAHIKDLIMLKAIEIDSQRDIRQGEEYYKELRNEFCLHIQGVVEISPAHDNTIQDLISEGYYHVD